MLALALGGRSVEEWRATMTVPEFEGWKAFYRLYPFDDLSRYHRPAALVAFRAGQGGDMQALLDFLQPPAEPRALSSAADINTMRAFGFTKRPGG